MSPRNKEEKLKRQDSKDDIRHIGGLNRRQKEVVKDETKSSSSSCQISSRDESKTGVRFFRRESKEDVGRESATITNSCVTKERPLSKKELQEWTEECVGDTTRPKLTESDCSITYKENTDTLSVTSQELREDKNTQEENNSEKVVSMANELKTEERVDEENAQKLNKSENTVGKNTVKDEIEEKIKERKVLGDKEFDDDKGEDTLDFQNFEHTHEESVSGSDADVVPVSSGEMKIVPDVMSPGKKCEDFQVVCHFKIWFLKNNSFWNCLYIFSYFFIESIHYSSTKVVD